MDDRDYRILQNKLKKKETCQDPCGRHIFSFDKNEKFLELQRNLELQIIQNLRQF